MNRNFLSLLITLIIIPLIGIKCATAPRISKIAPEIIEEKKSVQKKYPYSISITYDTSITPSKSTHFLNHNMIKISNNEEFSSNYSSSLGTDFYSHINPFVDSSIARTKYPLNTIFLNKENGLEKLQKELIIIRRLSNRTDTIYPMLEYPVVNKVLQDSLAGLSFTKHITSSLITEALDTIIKSLGNFKNVTDGNTSDLKLYVTLIDLKFLTFPPLGWFLAWDVSTVWKLVDSKSDSVISQTVIINSLFWESAILEYLLINEKNFFRNFVKEIDKDNGRITLGIDLPDDVNFKFDLSQQLSATHKLQIGASIIDAYNGLRRNTMAKERAVQLNIKSGLEWLFRLKL